MQTVTIRIAMLIIAATAGAADQSTMRVQLEAATERKPAPEFDLRDSNGKAANLAQYRGKVVLLDFWATWCTGCKQELPWFSELERKFGPNGFAVVGVSLDDGGWDVVKPFLAKAHVPYRMLLGNDATSRQYGIETMPDTFLLDKRGRIAAAYRGGLVNAENAAGNIQALLAER
jgi:peroxiredoxin